MPLNALPPRHPIPHAILKVAAAICVRLFAQGAGKHRHRDKALTTPSSCAAELKTLLNQRIVVLDGAMGTMIQARNLSEADYRGKEFARHPRDLRLNNDVLNLTQPEIVESIHRQYLEAGADIIETNTFNSTAISMAEYVLQDRVYDLNKAAAQIARRAVDRFLAESPGAGPRFIAGAIGPTSRTASMSQDVNSPASRAATFDQFRAAYAEQVRGLIDGGVDVLLVETIFDTLNAKAALFAIEEVFEKSGVRLPVMASVTIVDQSGRTLSGQTIDAFWISVSHVNLLSVGINCALGARQMRPYVEELSRVAPIYISCYPNAGLPNAFGGFDETPEKMCRRSARFRRQRLAQYRRRLLRLHARAHSRHRRRRQGPQAPRSFQARALHALLRPRASRHSPRHQFRQRRRAHQRHRLAPNSRSSSSTENTNRPSPSPASRSKAARK